MKESLTLNSQNIGEVISEALDKIRKANEAPRVPVFRVSEHMRKEFESAGFTVVDTNQTL